MLDTNGIGLDFKATNHFGDSPTITSTLTVSGMLPGTASLTALSITGSTLWTLYIIYKTYQKKKKENPDLTVKVWVKESCILGLNYLCCASKTEQVHGAMEFGSVQAPLLSGHSISLQSD